MRVTIVKMERGEYKVHVRPTRRGERKVSAQERIPKGAVGEVVGEMVRQVRRDEPTGAPLDP